MALVTKEFKLELSPGGCPDTVITASQGDIGRPYKANLFWDGEPWSAAGYDVALRGRKTDKITYV